MNDVERTKRRGVSPAAQVALCIAVLILAVWIGRAIRRPVSIPTSDSSATPVVMPAKARSVDHEQPSPPLARAIPLYTTYCSKCHGSDGHGDPDSLLRLTPPPRDFAGNNWRFPKTALEIRRVIREGIPGTAMPSMKHLFSDDQLQGLTDYVLHLSGSTPVPETVIPEHLRSLEDLGFTVFRNAILAPEMQLIADNGTKCQLADFSGRVVLVNFWGTMCSHCLQEMPAIAELENRYAGDGLTVVSICADSDDPATIAETAAMFAPGHTVYYDATGLLLQECSVNALPTFLIVDHRQQMIARKSGAIDWSRVEVAAALKRVLDVSEVD